ncbi:MAG: sulfite exporter TauE/SafE family protein [Proteobacteria bacterium]|nr:sulfite exporter TauE/SafE family protein [Pseudomonadota bacterium]
MTLDFLAPDLVPFHHLDGVGVFLLILIYGATAVIRGAFGFGAITPAVLFSTLVTEPHHAVLLALCAGVITQVQMIPFGLRHGDWKIAKPMIAAGFAAIAVGLLIFKKIEAGWLMILLGVVLAGVMVMDRYHVLDRLARKFDLRNMATAFGLSTTAGLIAGIAGGGGMYFYSVYLKLVCPTPALMRGTSILLGSIFLYWRFIIAIIVGLISFRLLIESLLLAPASWFGAWIGIRFFHRADTSRFYGAFQLVLVVGAGALLWKGFDRVL